MTLIEAINRSDDLKPNDYTYAEKVEWLSRLDGRIKNDIIDNHEGAEDVVFNGYSEDTDQNTKLLVPATYDDLYIHWLHAQVDYANGEIRKYNNCMAMFNASLQTYSNYYKRTHMPHETKIRFF